MILRFLLYPMFFLTNYHFIYFIPRPYLKIVYLTKNWVLRMMGARIGRGVTLGGGFKVLFPHNLVIGDHVKVAENAVILNYEVFQIGNSTEIGSELLVMTNEHKFDLNDGLRNVPLAKNGSISQDIQIGDGCYIGSRVTISSGANVGDYCVVAGSSFVNKPIQSHTICGGVPANLIRRARLNAT